MKKISVLLIMCVMMILSLAPPISANEGGPDRIYMVAVDRFLNKDTSNDIGVTEEGDPEHPFGGDFEGLKSELEYIKDMGFNTVMLTPVTERDDNDYLGYDVTDYSSIDESYGGEEGFKDFINQAHDMDLKVVVDMPTTTTDDYTSLENPAINTIQSDYYQAIDRDLIDLQNESNQEQYKTMLQEFVDNYDVDGISMFIGQDGVNGEDFLPTGVTTYGITTVEDITVSGFDNVANEENRLELAQNFGDINQEIPEFPEDNELILADHWFSERFTHHAAEANMFPGTRVQQLANYLYAYQGPSAMTYGTEVAFNGEAYPEIHPQMDLWTDQEVVEYLENISVVYDRHKVMAEGETETLLNESGQYIVRYMTSDVDFILNINNTSETQSNTFTQTAAEEGKILSGMLIGDMIRPHEGEYITVLDREETELYSVIEEAGFNNGYLYASIIIFGFFAVFVWVAASRSRKNKKNRY